MRLECLEHLEPYYQAIENSTRKLEDFVQTRVGQFTSTEIFSEEVTQSDESIKTKSTCSRCRRDENPRSTSRFSRKSQILQFQIFLAFLLYRISPVAAFPVSLEKNEGDFAPSSNFPKANFGFNAWDCNQPQSVTAFDMTKVDDCNQAEIGRKERSLKVQVLRAVKEHRIKVYKCEVRRTIQAEYCGGFQGQVNYGFPYLLENQKHYPLTVGDCKTLIEDRRVTIGDRVFPVEDIRDFGFDWMISGSRDTRGNCKAGDAFTTEDGKNFPNHAKIASAFGSVTTEKFSVDSATSMLLIDGIAVNSSMGHFLSNGIRYLWDHKDYRLENLECEESVREIFLGNATISEWENYNQSKPMLIGGDHQLGQYFGVQLTGEEVGVCGRNAKVTNLPGIFIVELRTGDAPIPALKPVEFRDMSTYVQLGAVFGYNFVQSANDQVRATEVLLNQVCKNQQEILKNKVANLLNNRDGRVGSVFEKGLHSQVKGSVVYFTKCTSVPVYFRLIDEVSNDIPVWYNPNPSSNPEDQNKGEEMYVDAITLVIKKGTRYYPAEVPNTPVMWKLQGRWYCKNGKQIHFGTQCGEVKVFKPDPDQMRQDILRPTEIHTGGFFPGSETFEAELHNQQDIEDYLARRRAYNQGISSDSSGPYVDTLPEKERGFFETLFGNFRWSPASLLTDYKHAFWSIVGSLTFLAVILFGDRIVGCLRIMAIENICVGFYAAFCPFNYLIGCVTSMKKQMEKASRATTTIVNNTDLSGIWSAMEKRA